MDSSVNQLESTWHQLLDEGCLSDEDAGKRQVFAVCYYWYTTAEII